MIAELYSEVDRILRQQKADREAAESAKAKSENTALLSKPPSTLPSNGAVSLPGTTSTSLPHERPPPAPPFSEKEMVKQRPQSTVINSFQQFRRKIGSSMHHSGPEKVPNDVGSAEEGPVPSPPPVPSFPPPNSAPRHNPTTVTPLDNICKFYRRAGKNFKLIASYSFQH